MSKKALSQEQFERIESFLLGKMSTIEASVFKQEMASNAELVESVNQMKIQLEAVESAVRKKQLEKFHEELASDSTKVRSIQSPFSKLPIRAVAASVIFLIGLATVYIFSDSSDSSDLFAQYFKPDAGLITSMGNNENYEFYRGMVDYKQGNYKEAISRWQSQLETKKENDTLNYFIGVSLMAQKNTGDAIPYLEKVEKVIDSQFIPDVFYFRALAELNEGNTELAKEYLTKSTSKSAKKLLQRI